MDEVAVQHVLTLIKPDRQKYAMMDFKESFLTNRQDSEGIIFRQETTSGINTIPEQRKRQLAAIIIDEFDEFLDVYVKISPKIFKLNGVYVIVLLKGEIPEIERIFELLRKIQVFKVIVMFDNGNDSVLLKSFRPFVPDNCDNTTPYVIDEFKEGGFVNSSRLVFQNTMKNLHKCPVRASIATTVEPYVIVKKLSNNSYDLRGQDIKMLEALSESLNFTVNYTYIGPEGYFFENGTVEGPLRTILDDEADLSASAWWLKSHRMKTLEATTSYISEKVIFIIPPGRELSTFEKLIFPFSTPLWLLTLLVFLVGYSVIFIVNHCSMTIRHFVFGRNVGNSYINMFIGFIGGSQHILPGRNFARFLLVMFLKYSLVMRTVYQGRFYQLLKSNVRIEEIQSIDEMIEKDFKFYLYTAYADNFMGTEAIRERTVLHSFEKIGFYINKTQDSSFKGAVGQPKIEALYYSQIRKARLRLCKEVVITIPTVIYTKKNFYLIDALNEKLGLINAAGLNIFWYLQEVQPETADQKDLRERKALTLRDLMGCFQILVIGLILTFIAFALEMFTVLC